MNSRKAVVLPKFQKIFDQIGENIKLARKRRKLTTEQVSERAGIHRATLYRIEKVTLPWPLGSILMCLG